MTDHRRTAVFAAVAILTAMAVATGAAVGQPEFSAAVVTYDGEAAVEDGPVRVRGTAPEANQVVAVLVDRNADTVATGIPVNDDGSFAGEVSFRDVGGRLARGEVIAFVVSPGGDGTFGQPGIGPDTAGQLVDFAENLERSGGLSPSDVVDRLRAETTDTTNSDDAAVETTFGLEVARVQITDIVPAGSEATGVFDVGTGETITVRGVTNRRPDAVDVRVTVVEGPSADDFDSATVEEWDTDGVWSVELTVPETVRPGRYAFIASDGTTSGSATVRVVEREPTTLPETETEPETTPPIETTVVTATETVTAPPEATPRTRTTPTTVRTRVRTTALRPTTTTPEQVGGVGLPSPGVGLVLGVLGVVLVGAALFVVVSRRRQRRRRGPRL
jgi:hypothetical protein